MDTFKINSRGQSRNIFYTSQICIIENKCRKDNNMYFSIQVSRKDQNLGLANEKIFLLLSFKYYIIREVKQDQDSTKVERVGRLA